MSEDLTAFALAAMPYAALLGLEITAAGPEEVVGRVAWAERLCTGGGVLHGGVLMGVADSCGALCAFFNLPEGGGTTTIESKTNFLRAISNGHLHARSTPLHAGRRTIVIETALTDDDGRLVGKVIQTQAVLAPGS